ncbi:hypothetical protein LSM04_004394 [Trypanosoma melophagium]|uniref:uncharacterized protein n=1 Tax=Trypanosoma melophagium TaxID=715481 RepID=UPI00351AA822|nr:hypothetical protein LSM04_004394 [Trypanosoma melophagium]
MAQPLAPTFQASKAAAGSHLLPPRLFRQDAGDVEATASSASSPPQGSAPRDVKCPSSPAEAKHAAHASPCMFSRLERDAKSGCVGVLLCDLHVWSACRAATAVGQEFRPGQRDCVRSAIPFRMSLQACLYIGAPRRREPSRLECPSPECKS